MVEIGNLEGLLKTGIGGALGYGVGALVTPYYSAYALAARLIGFGAGVYFGAKWGLSENKSHVNHQH